MNHNLLIFDLMIGAGLLGGITNFLRADHEKKNWLSFLKNVLMGISAALLIPLFLNMISSNLLTETASDSLKLFVLFGFCLVASLSSKQFIQSISDRLMNEIRIAKEAVEDIQSKTKPIIEKETERDTQEGEDEDLSQLRAKVSGIDEDIKKTLNALGGSKFTWRTVRGISGQIKSPIGKVLDSLNWLLSKNLAVKSAENGRWALTSEGLDILSIILQREKQK